MEVSGQCHTPPALLLKEKPLVPLGEGAGWTPELVCMQWEDKKIPPLPLLGIKPIIQSIASSLY
jgi:hypothetical protein